MTNAFTVAATATDRPKGSKSKGKPEGAQWAVLTEQILKQTPGEFILYEQFTQSNEAHKAGTRLRDKDSFKPGKAFAPLAGKVELAVINTGTNSAGEKIADLWIKYTGSKVTKPKAVRKTTKPITLPASTVAGLKDKNLVPRN